MAIVRCASCAKRTSDAYLECQNCYEPLDTRAQWVSGVVTAASRRLSSVESTGTAVATEVPLLNAPPTDGPALHRQVAVSIWRPDGRMPRGPFFGYMVVLVLGYALADVVVNASTAVTGILFPVLLLMWWVHLMVVIQRLHDLNTSGWFSLIGIIPLINALLGLWLLFMPGTRGDNAYGRDPTASY